MCYNIILLPFNVIAEDPSPTEDPDSTEDPTVPGCNTVSGPSANMPCIFPFRFRGVTYNECALDSDGYWCSTAVDAAGDHIGGQGNWGICSQDCPGVGT